MRQLTHWYHQTNITSRPRERAQREAAYMKHSEQEYLTPTYFLDYDHPSVAEFAQKHCAGADTLKEKSIRLYYAVRDTIRYDPYDVSACRNRLKASSVVGTQSGYCVAKAVLLTAAARHQNIPARLGFADVTNHLSTSRLRAIMGSNLFIYHGYTEMLIDGRWVKATPAFNRELCNRFAVMPLEFDGANDSIFHEYDAHGRKHMEYVQDHGHFSDLPHDLIFSAYRAAYPNLFREPERMMKGDFMKEAEQENRP